MRMSKTIILLVAALSSAHHLESHAEGLAETQAKSYVGTIDFYERISLGVTVNGTIETINVSPGDRVKKGLTLIALDDTPYQARKEKFQAELQQVSAELRKTKRDYQNAKELYERAALSTVALENASIRLEQSIAAVAQIKSELKLIEYDLSQSKITAPFDAWVMDVKARTRQTIVNTLQANSLVTLASASKYVVRIGVPLSVVKKLHKKSIAQVRIDDAKFSGKVASVFLDNKATDNKNKPTYEVLVEFDSMNQMFLTGEAARVVF